MNVPQAKPKPECLVKKELKTEAKAKIYQNLEIAINLKRDKIGQIRRKSLAQQEKIRQATQVKLWQIQEQTQKEVQEELQKLAALKKQKSDLENDQD